MNDDDPFQLFDEATAFLCFVAVVCLAFIVLHLS